MKQLVAVYDDSMFMFADKGRVDLKEDDKCVVYNETMGEFAPPLCVGSWSARMSPWKIPTDEQIERANQWIDKIPQENDDVQYD